MSYLVSLFSKRRCPMDWKRSPIGTTRYKISHLISFMGSWLVCGEITYSSLYWTESDLKGARPWTVWAPGFSFSIHPLGRFRDFSGGCGLPRFTSVSNCTFLSGRQYFAILKVTFKRGYLGAHPSLLQQILPLIHDLLEDHPTVLDMLKDFIRIVFALDARQISLSELDDLESLVSSFEDSLKRCGFLASNAVFCS